MQEGPLAGLRVVDLTDDSGRFATKMLAECGASIVRVGRGSPGPAMRAADAADRGGLLDWWYDGGKACASVDLESDQGRADYRKLAELADLIIDTVAPGRLAEWRVDHADLVAVNPRLVQVSLTPFGRTGPRAGWQTSDLVAAALGGPLSVCGLPDEPIAVWGRQAFNFGGFHAVICGLAGVRAARVTGAGQHVDLSLHEVVCSSLEQLWFQYWFDDLLPYPKIAARQGSVHWSRAYVVVPARSGWVLVTPTPVPANLFKWMLEEGFTEVNDLLAIPLEELLSDVPRIMKSIASFAQTIDAPELFWQAQERHVAFGEVQTVAHLAENPQHHFRHFFRDVAWDGSRVRVPGPLARFSATPAPAPQPPENIPAAVDEIIAGWGERREPATGQQALRKPLEGVRVLDFTHVLAGPHANRIFGDLGADIVKLSTAERSVSVNDPDMPFYYTWNRSKRAASLNMKHEQATDVVRRLVEHSDVMMENFSPGVLDRWGLSYETVRQWNPRIVYVTMSGCGHHGPWSHLVTYAPTIHALCGVTYLTNPPGRGDVGPGFSVNDHGAGLSAAVAVLAALEARERTGEGQHVDISQMETGAYLIGPAVLNDLTNARVMEPQGNVDPFGHLAPNECYPTSDGGWLAVTCRDDIDWERLVAATGITVPEGLTTVGGRLAALDEVNRAMATWAATVTADAGQELLQGAGVPAGRIQNGADLMADPQLVARAMWRTCDHAVFGERPYDRFPAIWSAMALEPYQPSPAFIGEHNFDVYTEVAGLDADEVGEGMATGLFE